MTASPDIRKIGAAEKRNLQTIAKLTATIKQNATGAARAGETVPRITRPFSEFGYDLIETKASEARYRGLLEAAPDAMVVVDQAGSGGFAHSAGRADWDGRRRSGHPGAPGRSPGLPHQGPDRAARPDARPPLRHRA